MYAKFVTLTSSAMLRASLPMLLFCVMLGLALVAIDIFLWRAGVASNATLMKSFFTMQAGADSWMPMEAAYDASRGPDGRQLYSKLFFEDGVKFQYPPTSLLPYKLSELLNIQLTASLLNRLSWGLVISVAIIIMLLGSRFLEQYGKGRVTESTKYLVVLFSGLTALNFFPLLQGYALGQIQTLLTACFCLSCLFWLKERKFLSAAMIGIICLFKPQFGLFLIWSAVRREWSFVAGFMSVVVPFGTLSLVVFGLDSHLYYLDVLSYLARHGESYFANQSVNGIVHRLLGNGESMTWQPNGFPPYNVIVHIATLVTSGALICLVLFFRPRRGPANVIEFSAVGLAFTMASPIAWDHHYGVLLPAACLVAAMLVLMKEPVRRTISAGIFVVALVLASKDLSPVLRLTAPHGGLAFSYIFFAALVLLVLTFTVQHTVFAPILVDETSRSKTS